jgi:adenosylcobinamide kinase/adenosylcobinamide-phosphate guanylyltransferase
MSARVTLVTGGARSGKSALAERLVRANGPGVYIATAEAGDAEMAARIAAHQAARGDGWRLVEAPLDLAAALKSTDGGPPRLVDCLTLWLSNLMLAGHAPEPEVAGLLDTLARQSAPVVLVTNEVGAGIVPENALARAFRDQAGWMNQRVAGAADEVWMSVSGCALRLKPGTGALPPAAG